MPIPKRLELKLRGTMAFIKSPSHSQSLKSLGANANVLVTHSFQMLRTCEIRGVAIKLHKLS